MEKITGCRYLLKKRNNVMFSLPNIVLTFLVENSIIVE